MKREAIEKRLASRPFVVGRDSAELEHLANLMLEGSYTKEHGILAPEELRFSGLPTVRSGERMHVDTYDPLFGAKHEVTIGDFEDDVDEDDYSAESNA
jgi:hypothetical protein